MFLPLAPAAMSPNPDVAAPGPCYCSCLQAVTHYNNPKVLAEVSCNLGEPMVGIDVRQKGFNSYANRSE